jgi:hypothetical protein
MAVAQVTEIVISFTDAGLPPGLNQTKGHHWGATTGERKKWRELACARALEVNLRVPPTHRALVHWHVFLGSRRARDEDNLRGGMKPVQDGLVDAGVIRGDSVWDIETKYTFSPDGPPGFIIVVSELDQDR